MKKNIKTDNNKKNKSPSKKQEMKANGNSSDKIISNELLWIIALVGISFVGVYAFLPWHGIVSTIPLVIVASFCCVFLKTGEMIKSAVFFLIPFSICVLLDESMYSALFLSVCCVVFYLSASFSVKLYKSKKNILKIASAGLLVLAFTLHVFVNSTPWNNSHNTDAINNYLQMNYSDEKLLVSDIHFNSFDRTYSVSMIPGTDNTIELDLVFKDGSLVKDEFINYSEKYNMIVGAGKITYVIRKKYPELKFSVESNSIKGYPFYTADGSHLATTEPLMNYSRYMDFSVYFTSYNSIEKFASVAEECFRALLLSGFCCRNITFYGGIATRYIVKISVPFNSYVGNLKNYVTPCDDNVFLYSLDK
jgi:hypothetical protein